MSELTEEQIEAFKVLAKLSMEPALQGVANFTQAYCKYPGCPRDSLPTAWRCGVCGFAQCTSGGSVLGLDGIRRGTALHPCAICGSTKWVTIPDSPRGW